jgi:hypothetical protein
MAQRLQARHILTADRRKSADTLLEAQRSPRRIGGLACSTQHDREVEGSRRTLWLMSVRSMAREDSPPKSVALCAMFPLFLHCR